MPRVPVTTIFINISFNTSKSLTFAHEMMRIATYTKEFVQYVGIILIASISAFWLTITGKRHH
jgi:hypothetical protein